MSKIHLTDSVRDALGITHIKDNLIFKRNGEVAKIFKVKIDFEYEKLDKGAKIDIKEHFKEVLEELESEIQIEVVTSNSEVNTFQKRIADVLLREKKSQIPDHYNPIIQKFIRFLTEETKRLKPMREHYLIISFDDYKLKHCHGLKKVAQNVSSYLTKKLNSVDKYVFTKWILKLEDYFADVTVHNFKKKENLHSFIDKQTQIVKKHLKVSEPTEDEVISLNNDIFYESAYKDGIYYSVLDLIKMFAHLNIPKPEKKQEFVENISLLFEWEDEYEYTDAIINRNSYRILSFFEYPEKNYEIFLDRILTHPGNFRLSLFFKQTTKKIVLDDLEKKRDQIKEKLNTSALSGFGNKPLEKAQSRLQRIIDFVKRDNEKMFLMSCYMLLKELNPERMQTFSDKMSMALDHQGIDFKLLPLKDLKKDRDFELIAPINNNLMKNYKFITSSGVGNMYPFLYDFSLAKNYDKIKEDIE